MSCCDVNLLFAIRRSKSKLLLFLVILRLRQFSGRLSLRFLFQARAVKQAVRCDLRSATLLLFPGSGWSGRTPAAAPSRPGGYSSAVNAPPPPALQPALPPLS